MIDWGRELFLLVASIVYAVLGGALLLLAYKLFDWATPHDLGGAIFAEKNVAAAIAVGAYLVALAVIIAAAIH
ncbi:MAG TPA: DUF350 domain-containing protein [Chloroflexota bacterium]|nr:DUF350 domain-containing protein [Chloroflexota bacterium]HZU07717.1 DUF350 domain-containing protein [Chloroflexota bacterium]